MQRIELKTFLMLNKHSTTEVHLQPQDHILTESVSISEKLVDVLPFHHCDKILEIRMVYSDLEFQSQPCLVGLII